MRVKSQIPADHEKGKRASPVEDELEAMQKKRTEQPEAVPGLLEPASAIRDKGHSVTSDVCVKCCEKVNKYA